MVLFTEFYCYHRSIPGLSPEGLSDRAQCWQHVNCRRPQIAYTITYQGAQSGPNLPNCRDRKSVV